jgi:hypothetical protein
VAGGDRGTHGEERCLKRSKELKRPGQRLKVIPRTECDEEFLWKPYVPQRNDGILYIYIYNMSGLEVYKMLINTWQELEYRLDICRATTGAQIEVYGCA